MRKLLLSLGAVVSLLGASTASADVVIDWNNNALDAIRVDRTAPPKAARALAIVQVAVFDAVNSATGLTYNPYLFGAAPGIPVSVEAAAAAAAHRSLVALFPAQQAALDAELAISLDAIPAGSARTAGVAFGQGVADAILALRANDHSGDVIDFEYPVGANWWTPTPPAFAPNLLPNWPQVTPWAMRKGNELRPEAPPPTNSSIYTESYDEVALLGVKNSPLRTADQTQIALFWADNAGTATPPGHWHLIAQSVSQDRHLTLLENARLFALLGITVADAAIVAWDVKYAYCNWRPVTGIRGAFEDGNPNTYPDPGWEPLIATPPFPSYTSGHSTFSSSAARLLALFFGTDNVSFSTTSDGLPGVTRSYTSFSQAAEEAGQSRIYGGIHWQFDNTAGLSSGRELGNVVFFSQLRPVESPSSCAPDANTLCLDGGRFRVRSTFDTGTFSGSGKALTAGDRTGSFWFFGSDNTELTVKVLNACGEYDRYWVFASGLTNVEVLITVTDTQSGKVRSYFNPQGKSFAPVQDTDAFATCP